MAKNPYDFLRDWSREHVNATAYQDKGEAERLASECLRDAKKAGMSEAGVVTRTHAECTLAG